MVIIGLTGGIATGKSTVSKMLIDMGAVIFDADKEAHKLLDKGGAAEKEIKKKFIDEMGFDILSTDGGIDRKKLGSIVFSNTELLKYLEDVMHYQIEKKLYDFIEDEQAKNTKLLVLDVPLLIEKGWQDKADEVWLVHIPQDVQFERLMKRDTIDLNEAKKRIDSQMHIDEKKKFADIIIDNSKTLDQTKKQVEKSVKRHN